MNWKKEATEKLQRLGAMRQALHSIPEELARLEAEATQIRSSTRTDIRISGGTGREDVLLSNLVHRQELEHLHHQTHRWVSTVEAALDTLAVDEQRILELLFVYPKPGSLDTVCAELSIEKSSVYRRRDLALRRFTVALYGCEES